MGRCLTHRQNGPLAVDRDVTKSRTPEPRVLTSEVEVKSIRALTRLASPSMLRVPMVEVLMVLMGLYW